MKQCRITFNSMFCSGHLILPQSFLRHQILHSEAEMADTAQSWNRSTFCSALARAQRSDVSHLPVGFLISHFPQSYGSSAKPQLPIPMTTRSPWLLQDSWTVATLAAPGSESDIAFQRCHKNAQHQLCDTHIYSFSGAVFLHQKRLPSPHSHSIFPCSKINPKIRA